jgi:hypothetical protein
VKALEVESLELKQAQHQQFMCELKTQLQKVITAAEGNYWFYEFLIHGLLLNLYNQ